MIQIDRFPQNPIIHPAMSGLEGGLGHNINGPSLIRVPGWVRNPLGKYYLYFAHHNGLFIRLAFADALAGPWTIHAGGVLNYADGPGRHHIASPDVHVDESSRRIRLYFHQPTAENSGVDGQASHVALSPDGIHFQPRGEILGKPYFRVFQFEGWRYALAKNDNTDGILYRSCDGLRDFEPGPHFLPGVRHTAVWLAGKTLRVFYSLIGEAPEQIYLTEVDLAGDWKHWQILPGRIVLEPDMDYEGVRLPLVPSRHGADDKPVRQLRDPAFFEEDGQRYLLYSIAGEQGIAIARIMEGQ